MFDFDGTLHGQRDHILQKYWSKENNIDVFNLAQGHKGTMKTMKFDQGRFAKLLKTTSREYAQMIHRIWKDGHERASASVIEERKLDREKHSSARTAIFRDKSQSLNAANKSRGQYGA